MKIQIYKDLEFPADHYFSGKFVLFAGMLERCSRRDAMDRLFFDCEGIPVDGYAVWVEYLVAAKGVETTADYKKVKKMEKEGFCTILTEREFFDALDGSFVPPENPNKKDSGVIVFSPIGMSDEEHEAQKATEQAELIAVKREEYLNKRKSAQNKYDILLQNEIGLRFDKAQVDMMQTALERYGEAAQVYQTIEESAELIVALNKHTTRKPTPETLENIMDEIADMEIMLAQMRLTFGVSDEMLHKRLKKKFTKLEKYMKKGE